MFYPIGQMLHIDGFYTFFECCYAEDFYFGGEHHDFWEAVYCIGGATGISADEKIYRLCPGDFVLHPPMVHHKIWSETSSRAHVMIFSFKGEGPLLDRLGGAYSCDEELQEKWNALFCRMKASGSSYGHTGFLQYLTQWPNEAQEVVNLCENQLLALESHGLPLGFNQSRSALNYKQIVQTMKHNLDKNLTVEELGMQCGLSASSMKKLFRQFNSMGIHEYYLHLKMKEAVRLLEEGRTVTETAERLGFSDQSYFSTAFKREMNEMPTRFRRNRT